VSSPASTPVSAPVSSPVSAPASSPVSVPASSPVSVPASSPVSIPVTSPVGSPVTVPTERPDAGQPTHQPSSYPSGVPSVQPSAAPSQPTFSPTISPHIHEVVKITGDMILKFVKTNEFTNSTKKVLIESIYNISGNPTKCRLVDIENLHPSVNITSFRRLQSLTTTATTNAYDYEVIFENTYLMTDYPAYNSTYLAFLKKEAIKSAVVDGTFEDVLRAKANENGVPALAHTSCNDIALTSSVTTADDADSNSSNDSPTLSAGAIAGITIGCFVGAALLGFLVYHYVVSNRYKQAGYAAPGVAEHQLATRDHTVVAV
jgi:hypothetical protein